MDICLTSLPHAQHCRAIRFFLWNLEPRSVPLPEKGLTKLGLHLGSIDHLCHWLANWNLAYLDHKASCLLVSTGPSLQVRSTLAISLTQSGTLPQLAGSSWVASQQIPGSVLAASGSLLVRNFSPLGHQPWYLQSLRDVLWGLDDVGCYSTVMTCILNVRIIPSS